MGIFCLILKESFYIIHRESLTKDTTALDNDILMHWWTGGCAPYSSFRGDDHKVLKTSVRPFYLYSIVFNPRQLQRRDLLHFATSPMELHLHHLHHSIDLPLNYNIPIAILVGSRRRHNSSSSSIGLPRVNLLPHILRKFE